MLKIDISHLKCGEIYRTDSCKYEVRCCSCDKMVNFDSFKEHFEEEHLPCEIPPAQFPIVFHNEGESSSPPNKHSVGNTETRGVEFQTDPLIRSETPLESIESMIDESTVSSTPDEAVDSANLHKEMKDLVDTAQSENRTEECEGSWLVIEGDSKTEGKDIKTYTCPICQRTYLSESRLITHTKRIHRKDKTPRECHECGKVFTCERYFRAHMFRHTGIVCDVCGKSFTQVGNLMMHKKRHADVKPFQCQECEYSFYTEKELKAHMIRHTGFLPHICEVCGKRCRDAGVLTAHKRRHTGERPAKCEVCGKCFYSFHDLNVHAVSHSNERPFICQVCGSSFQRKKTLRVHEKLHTRDLKYQCRVCEKAFAIPSGLRSHMRSHDVTPSKSIGTRCDVSLAR